MFSAIHRVRLGHASSSLSWATKRCLSPCRLRCREGGRLSAYPRGHKFPRKTRAQRPAPCGQARVLTEQGLKHPWQQLLCRAVDFFRGFRSTGLTWSASFARCPDTLTTLVPRRIVVANSSRVSKHRSGNSGLTSRYRFRYGFKGSLGFAKASGVKAEDRIRRQVEKIRYNAGSVFSIHSEY